MANLLFNKTYNITNYKNIVSLLNISSYSTRVKKVPVLKTDLKASEDSLQTRSYLRNYKSYNPPEDVRKKIEVISLASLNCQDFNPSQNLNNTEKFQILADCFKELKHAVPNSLLYKIKTLGDIVEFYETPVDTRTPLDAMKDIELPRNLHVQQDYYRFHPETDSLFGGKTAFPENSTIVTGLKYKKKYKEFKANPSWYEQK